MALASVFLPLIEPGQVPAPDIDIGTTADHMKNWRNVRPDRTPMGMAIRLILAVFRG